MPKNQDTALRLMIIDDSVEDAEAIVSGLRNAGIAVRPLRPATADEFVAMLGAQPLDLVLASQEAKSVPLADVMQHVVATGKDIPVLQVNERARFLDQSVAAASRTVEITHDQYREGVIDFTPVFLFEGTLAQQQDELAIAQGQIALSLVDLYRALGGGWEMRMHENPPASTQPASKQQAMATEK